MHVKTIARNHVLVKILVILTFLLLPALSAFAENCSNHIYCEDFDNNFAHSNWADWSSIGRYCQPYSGTNPATDCEGQSSQDYHSAPYSLRYTVEIGENDGGWPQLNFPQQSASAWTYVRWYQKLETGYQLGSQLKGISMMGAGGTGFLWKFQIRQTYDIPAYLFDEHWHFGFHSYLGGEKFTGIHNPHAEEVIGAWHCYEVGVQPSTKSLKLWIDGVLKANWTNSAFVEDATLGPNKLNVSCYYGYDADGARSPKTQSYYIDNLVISNHYIGPRGDIPSISPPTGLKIIQ